MFSKELTDKVYDHIQSTYPTRRMQMDKSLSDSNISKSSQRDCGVPFSPEVLHVLVQESVEKFLQNILFWLENDSLAKTIQNNKISCVVEDIVRALTPSEEGDMLDQMPTKQATDCPRRSQVQLQLPPSSQPSLWVQ